MNIYEKMNKCKKDLSATQLKKSGKNEFTGQPYFQLQDFLPTILTLCVENKLNTAVSFPDKAELTITNIEEPTEKIIVLSPFGSAALKGCHEVQNIGAVETYQRRYLYMAAFDIIETDILDSTIVNAIDEEINKLKRAQDKEELAKIWGPIYKKYKNDKATLIVLTKEKDIMKESLNLGSLI